MMLLVKDETIIEDATRSDYVRKRQKTQSRVLKLKHGLRDQGLGDLEFGRLRLSTTAKTFSKTQGRSPLSKKINKIFDYQLFL
jgi:hypothetical protein